MLDDANQMSTTTPEVTEAPVSQPEVGSDTQAAETNGAESAPAQGRSESQPPPMIPKWRFDELNSRMQAAEARLREINKPAEPAPQQPAAPKVEDYATYEAYVRADAAHVAEQKAESKFNELIERQRQAQANQSESQRRQGVDQNWSAKANEALSKHQDFEQRLAMSQPLENPYTLEAMKSSEIAGDLAYHLACNQDLVARLNGMHPIHAATELGRIEAKLKHSIVSTPAPAKKPAAGIPAMTPVNPGTTSSRRGDSMSKEDIVSRLYPNS